MLLSNKACPEAHPGYLLFLLATLPARALFGVLLLLVVALVNLVFAFLMVGRMLLSGTSRQSSKSRAG